MKTVTDSNELKWISRNLSALIMQLYGGAVIIRKQPNWVAVPFAGHICLKEKFYHNLASFFKDEARLFVSSLYRQPFETVFSIQPSPQEIYNASWELGMFYHVIFGEEMDLITIDTSKDYFIVVGKKEEICEISGEPVEESYKNFLEFSTQSAYAIDIRDRQHLLKDLKETYASATEGTFVMFPSSTINEFEWPPRYIY